MRRKLIIDGNAVYEIDEDCMLRKQLKQETGWEAKEEPWEREKEKKQQREQQ